MVFQEPVSRNAGELFLATFRATQSGFHRVLGPAFSPVAKVIAATHFDLSRRSLKRVSHLRDFD
jgi:hypothetical protein